MTSVKYDLLPCPCCGCRFDERYIHFYTDEGELLGDLEMISDFDHITNPRNAIWLEDWDKIDEADRDQIVRTYLSEVEEVNTVAVVCPFCGFSKPFNVEASFLEDERWFQWFADEVNRRSEKAMEVALQHSVDVLADGPVRRAYQNALSALQAIPEVIKQADEDAEEAQEWLDARGDDDDY